MPTKDLVSTIAEWWSDNLSSRSDTPYSKFRALVPSSNLNLLDDPAVQRASGSPFWRFRPSALVIEELAESHARFNVVMVFSNAVSLKDVGELNCYMRLMGAPNGLVVSPRGVSNEVRLLQAERNVRARLFEPNPSQRIYAALWNPEMGCVEASSVLPLEARELFSP